MKLKAAALAIVMLLPAVASAHQAGDFFIRAGTATVRPTGGSDDVLGLGEFNVSNNTQLGLTFTYMATDNIGVELLGATPFSHHVGTPGTGNIANLKQLPPSLVVQWYFSGLGKFNPYIGAGVNYTRFFQERFNDTGRNLGLSDLHAKDSWGFAGVAGLDYQLTDNWMLNASVWYMNIDTDVSFRAGGVKQDKIHTDINPVVFFFGAGYKF
ncbi:outer membrane protein OmpW [Erwinia sp. OLTSP20]|uniref:outer membrane protein OmpW n=1 Tax=unclassified Erwinia TaxID=2622719 RepID=UPI000C17660F|nr:MULTISPECIES: outer membrane protein OmpW [unclassified Erwinia]PIJ51815.1 outer membrane protein OmpW [Erwinia sp. OAMSP11]PIJ74403.1 outer membrane protein OmpW [Erwinia sp. OLSSP12]PIJ83764.1 outer membrane protein OmpW [Erwinia sp. OLCASP19]PIJ86807.1 outer membrane protein OmpW [Erwinia sp. OLMTSP26]PIJ88214.1 outer membrane protein OmpW [Erwinia sp. OLMDSP33]